MAADSKPETHPPVEPLPEDATRHEVYVRQAIEAGLQDSQAGRTLDVKEVRAKLGQL